MLKLTASPFYKRWIGKTFRFRLVHFRVSRSLYARRFTITEAATLLLLAYFASKLLGLVRQILFNSLFGAGSAATAYYVAFNIPDTIFNLIAGGALVHALVPVFLSYEKEHGQTEVWRFVSLVFNVLLVTLTIIIFVAEIVAPQFVSNVLAPGLSPKEQALTMTLTRIMLLQPLILGLGTIATAVLHSKRQFVPSAISIAIYDLGLIGGVLFARAIPGVGIYGPTIGLLVSAFCQVVVLLPGLMKLGARYTFSWNLRNPGLHQLLRLLGPNILMVAITSLGSIIITSFASYLPDKASIAAIHNAAMLSSLPLTLLGLTLANALLPQITIYATNRRYVRMSWTIWRIVGMVTLLSIPAAALLYVLGKPAISILFQHGAFNAHASALTGTALLGLAIGLPGQTVGLLTVLGFYALKDAVTPLLINVFELVIHIGLAFLLLHTFKGGNAILALPLSTSLSATAAASALCLLLFLRLRAKVKLDAGMQRLRRRRRKLRAVAEADQSMVSAMNRGLRANESAVGAINRPLPAPVGPDLSWAPPIHRPSSWMNSPASMATPLDPPGQKVQQQSGSQFARLPVAADTFSFAGSDAPAAQYAPTVRAREIETPFATDALRPAALSSPDDMIDTKPIPASNGHNTLLTLVQRHIASINNPGADPVMLMEMLTSICQQLRSDEKVFYDTVIDSYKQAAGSSLNPAVAQFVLGQLYAQGGSYDRAVDAYILAMQYAPFEVVARIHAAQCLLAEGLPSVAVLQLEQALQSLHSASALPLHARIWQARPLAEGETAESPDVVISQLLARATESKARQEQMHSFLRRVNQTPSSYHEVAGTRKQFVTGHGRVILQEDLRAESRETESYDELADIYKIQGILHETISKLCEQVVIYLRNNQLEQARTTMQRIGALYTQLGSTQEADTHIRRSEALASNKLKLL